MRSAFLHAMAFDGATDWKGRDPFSVFHGLLLTFAHWRARPQLPTTKLVAGDSGGFTVATQGAYFDPIQVLRWQMEKTHFGFILDVPPYSGAQAVASEGPAALWAESLKWTLANVRRALPHYRPAWHPFRWWGVCQGETREQQHQWWSEVSGLYPFDGSGEGWAMRPYPNNDLAAVARCVRFAADRGVENLHLLQTTGARAVAVLLALGQIAGLGFVSYDSQSAGRRAFVRKTWDRPPSFPAFQFTETVERTREGETHVRDYLRDGGCPCSGCQWFREDEIPEGADFSPWLLLHNYSVMRENFDALALEAARDPEALIREAAGPVADAVFRAFEGD